MSMPEQELPPIGADVEMLLGHAHELEHRFENPQPENPDEWILSVAWIHKYAEEILKSLPKRYARRHANRTPDTRPPHA